MLKEYKELVLRLAAPVDQNKEILAEALVDSLEGIAGLSNGYLDHIKKNIFYDKPLPKNLENILNDPEENLLKKTRVSIDLNLLHGLVGIVTESGELAQRTVSILDKEELDTEDLANLQEEFGDLMFYLFLACHSLGFSFEQVLQVNMNKLNRRYASGSFSKKEAINRDLSAEQIILVDNLYEQWEEPYDWDVDEYYPEPSSSQGQMVDKYLELSNIKTQEIE